VGEQDRQFDSRQRRLRVLLFIGFAILGLLLTILIVGFLTTSRSYDEDAAILASLLTHSSTG